MCGAAAIDINALPNPARTEVETALEDGQYETEEELYLPYLIDIDTTSLMPGSWFYKHNEVAYRALVNQEGATTTLELEEAVPSHGEKSLKIHNETDEQLSIEIQITRSRTDEIVLEDTVTIESGSDAEAATFDRQFGDYQLTVITDSEEAIEIAPGTSWTEQNDKEPMDEIEVACADSSESEPEPEPDPDPVHRLHIHPWECASWAE